MFTTMVLVDGSKRLMIQDSNAEVSTPVRDMFLRLVHHVLVPVKRTNAAGGQGQGPLEGRAAAADAHDTAEGGRR